MSTNSSPNFDNDHSVHSQSEFAEFGKGVLFSTITFATIVGNSLSLLALFVTKKWHTRYLIVSLATTDLLLGAFVMPFATISAVKLRWVFGTGWCDIQGSLGFLLCQVSVVTIMCVSIERYVLFSYPSTHFNWVQSSSKTMKWLVITTWIFGGVWSFLAWQIAEFSYANELLNCAVRWRHNYYFTLVCGVITSCVPIATILFCNFKVTMKVAKMHKKWSVVRKRSESDTVKRNIAEVRISRMLLIVTVAFLVCWAPYSIGGLCYLLPNCSWPDEYFVASVFFVLFNSCVNPIIYGTFDRRFRKALRFIVLKLFKFTSTGKTIGRMAALNMSPVRGQQCHGVH